jgi:hypothetical protein
MKRIQAVMNRAISRLQAPGKSMLLMGVLVLTIVFIVIAIFKPTVGFADDPVDTSYPAPAIYKIYLPIVERVPRIHLAADCVDGDGDGYVVCVGCDPTSEQLCGECDDGDPAIHPGATELCDGVDNDCDSIVDNGFIVGRESSTSTTYDCGDYLDNDGDGFIDDADPECQAAYCFHDYPLGCSPAITGTSCCLTRSFLECNVDGSGTFCPVPEVGLNEPGVEDYGTSPLSCHDEMDNDCDRLVDADDVDGCPASPELCNGLDDDYNGFVDDGFFYLGVLPVGDSCSVGVGGCERTGTVLGADESTATCSVAPAPPGSENTPGVGRCVDGIDNDCDGLTDLNDPGCQEAEKCDGADTDGDGSIDEDFSTELGLFCSVGEGACYAEGIKVCSLDGMETVCSAVAGLPSTEGPTGVTCSDGVDNDCDGLTDEGDPSCGSADLGAWCALPYLRGEPGNDCTGWHEIRFGTDNAGPDVVVTAELLSLDVDGNIIESAPVSYGDAAHLASRLHPDDHKFSTRTNKQGTWHEVFAPIPVLRVTVEDGLNRAQAYCSNIPYLQVVEPKGTVVSESEGDVTHVLAAVPFVDPLSIVVWVDGVDLLDALGIADLSACTPLSPCSGSVMINTQMVEVSELTIQTSPIGTAGANTLSMNLANLGCGGHVVLVEGNKLAGSFPDKPAAACHVDDLRDNGMSSGLAVAIDSPYEGQVVSSAPVTVTGKACSGREIVNVAINGKVLDISGQTLITGDGEYTADTYEVMIDTTLDETDIVQDVATGDTHLGTFDAGSNRLIGIATDDLGNRAFKTLIFAVGDVAGPSVALRPAPGVELGVEGTLEEMLAKEIQVALESTTTEVENAFVVGLAPDAVQTLLDAKCDGAVEQFKNEVRSQILAVEPIYKKVSGGCSCDPKVKIWITDVSFGSGYSCPVTFHENQFHVTVNLPDVIVDASAYGRCKRTGLFGECWAETIVDGWAVTTISGIKLDFDVTENQLKGAPGPEPVFDIGTEANVDAHISSDVNCVAAVCNWVIEGLVTIFTFGTVDLDLTPEIDISKNLDFNTEIGAGEPDPIYLEEIKVDEEEVEEYGQSLQGILDDVEITANGIVAGLNGEFTTTNIDPEVDETPGAILTPAGLPGLPVANAEDVFVALADDTFNQLFASLAASGGLKTGCQDSGKTVGDLLPASCEDISVGECSNDASISCNEDADCGGGGTCEESAVKTGVARGTCHAFTEVDCDTLPLWPPLQRATCNATRDNLDQINISGNTPLLFCALQDIPPRLLITDDNGTPEIETVLRLNDLSVAMLVDRNANGLDSELSSTPNCMAEGAPTEGDCAFFAVCLDLNLETAMQLAAKHCANDPSIICTGSEECTDVGGACVDACEAGKPGLVTRVNEISVTVRAAGVPCGGAPTPGDDELVADTAAENQTIGILFENANRFTPPVCIEGLTLGGFVQFANPTLIAIEADGDTSFEDYLGITGDISP